MGTIVTIGRLTRELETFSIGSVQYPYLPVVGDRDLIVEASRLLALQVPSEAEILLAPEFGGVVVAHQLSIETGLPYVVARKKMIPIFGCGIAIPVKSAASKREGRLYLDEGALKMLRARAVVLVDEVVLGGATMAALQAMVDLAQAYTVATVAIATQGELRPGITSLLHLSSLGS